MTLQIRQKLIAAVTFLSGLYFFLEFMLPEKIGDFKFGAYHEQILRGVTVVGSMAIGLGLINILRVHGGRLTTGQKGWPNSLALLGGLVIMCYVQGAEFVASQKNNRSWRPFADLALFVHRISDDAVQAPESAPPRLELARRTFDTNAEQLRASAAAQLELFRAGESEDLRAKLVHTNEEYNKQLAVVGPLFDRLQASHRGTSKEEQAAALKDFDPQLKLLTASARELATQIFERHPIHRASRLLQEGFFVPLGAAMFSLLAFYIASAAYRSFRVKSVEASVMMLTSVVVILGQIPFGPIYISPDLPAVRLWLLQYINTPGNRAIYFGTTIAAFAMAVRMWFSLERNPLDLNEQEEGGER
ncbi:MAG: hypothetical protein U0136_06950 [Bdellovibrionota bacterium]